MNPASGSAHHSQPSPQVVKEAIRWSLRLREQGVHPSLYDQCVHWRSQHAEHECAWQRVQTLHCELNNTFAALPPSRAAIEALENGSQRLNRRQALKLLSGVAVLGAAGWMARDTATWQAWRADFATNVGQRQQFRLQDGTRLQLNTDSAVDQRFTASQRLILLTRGEILVAPAADSSRPVLVQSRHGLFEAWGGRFVVRQDEQQTRVSVSEGQLLIRSPAALPISVLAGETYVVTSSHAALRRELNMDPTAWAEGLIVTRDMRLQDFLAEVGRYRRGYLGCAKDVADLRLSGVFRLEDTDKLLSVLPQTLPVQLTYRTPWWVTLGRRV